MRLVIASALLLPGRENKGEGQNDAPPEPDGLATSVQPLTGARWWDGEMPDGFRRMPARQKPILVAWGQPLISWRKQIKVEKCTKEPCSCSMKAQLL